MNLEITKKLLDGHFRKAAPEEQLVYVLESAIELISLPDNDFSWSGWENAEEAIKELEALVMSIQNGQLPNKMDIAILFAPTGPIQEVSISSGWGEAFLRLASEYDAVSGLVWRHPWNKLISFRFFSKLRFWQIFKIRSLSFFIA